MTPQQLRGRADALDALRPGTDGDGFDASCWDREHGHAVSYCSACKRFCNGRRHETDCPNVLDSALKHDGAQALRREAARIERVQHWLAQGYPGGSIEALLNELHADPAGQEQP